MLQNQQLHFCCIKSTSLFMNFYRLKVLADSKSPKSATTRNLLDHICDAYVDMPTGRNRNNDKINLLQAHTGRDMLYDLVLSYQRHLSTNKILLIIALTCIDFSCVLENRPIEKVRTYTNAYSLHACFRLHIYFHIFYSCPIFKLH